jgi:hypothetical protein
MQNAECKTLIDELAGLMAIGTTGLHLAFGISHFAMFSVQV